MVKTVGAISHKRKSFLAQVQGEMARRYPEKYHIDDNPFNPVVEMAIIGADENVDLITRCGCLKEVASYMFAKPKTGAESTNDNAYSQALKVLEARINSTTVEVIE